MPGSPRFEIVGIGPSAGQVPAPYFALRRRRGSQDGLPPASRFQIPPNDPVRGPGWVRFLSNEQGGTDEYLPGFRISEELRSEQP